MTTTTENLRERPPWPGDAVNGNVWGLMSLAARRAAGAQRVCRLCARAGLPNNRFSWHPRCGAVAGAGLYWCLRRQRGLCASCPTRLAQKDCEGVTDWAFRVLGSGWITSRDGCWVNRYPDAELDHITPLWQVALMAPPRDRLLRWWLPGNLQALCLPCHRAKSARESQERAQARSPQLQLV